MDFKEFLAHAKPNSKFVYHIGLLMRDRQTFEPWSRQWGQNELHFHAAGVWRAYLEGKVHLVQEKRRDVPGVYIYYAVKRPKPYTPVPNRRPTYRPGIDGPNYRGTERFGSYAGPRSTYQTTKRSGVIASNSY